MSPHLTKRQIRRSAAFRTSWRFAVLCSVLVLAESVPVHAQEDTLLVDAVVRLFIQDGPEEVVPALSYNSTMLVPLQRFLALSEIPLVDFSYGDSVVVQIESEGVRLAFLPDSQRMVRRDSAFNISQHDAIWRDGDLYLATSALDLAFDVGTQMEWSNLTVFIGRSATLPVIRRMRRERRRARLFRPPPELPEESSAPQSSGFADGAVFEWSLNAPTHDPVDNFGMKLGFGAKLLDGSLELRYQRKNYTGGALSEMRGSWARAWPQREWVRQVRLGDVFSNGLRARSVQGLVVTNAPFMRAAEFDVDEVLGHLQAGWEVEVYDRGRLRSYHEVDARGVYRSPVPLQYGQNAFQFVLYGPGGEIVRQTRTIRVPFSRLPEGKFEYAVAGGRCRGPNCSGLLTTDVRYGLTTRVTLQAGSDYLWRDAQRGLWQPYAAVSAAILPQLHANGEAVYDGRLRGSLSYEPSPVFRVSAAHTIFDQDGSTSLPAFFERHRTEASVYWRPMLAGKSLSFQLTNLHSTGPSTMRTLQQLTTTAYLGRVRYRLGLTHDRLEQGDTAPRDRSGIDISAETTLSGRREWLRATNIRTGVGVDAGYGFSMLRAGIGRQIARKVRFDVDVGWYRDGGFGIDISLNTILRGPRVGTRNHFAKQTGATGVTFVDGSVIVDPDTRYVHVSDGRDLGRAGVAGTVFFDENGNGSRDENERGLEGVPIHVGGWFDETDAEGRFSAWDLFPFEASYIEVDSLAFADPRLVPAATTIRVTPTPNSFQSVDIPVVVGAEVSGYVLFQDAGLAGVPVILRNVATGRTIELLTFSDGVFYRIAVQPGDYEVVIPEASLDRLGATAAPLTIHIPSGPGEKFIDDVVIDVQRTSNEPGLLDQLVRNHRARYQREQQERN